VSLPDGQRVTLLLSSLLDRDGSGSQAELDLRPSEGAIYRFDTH
jgi:hypothetical protein